MFSLCPWGCPIIRGSMISFILLYFFSCVRYHSLSISTTPNQAIVLINGVPACYKYPCTQKLERGQYRIDIRAENYHSESFLIKVEDDLHQDIRLSPKGGWITIVSEPSQLAVSIDGALIGKTPIRKFPIQYGRHTIDVPDGCFETLQKTIDVFSDQEKEIRLEPKYRTIPVRVSLLDDQLAHVFGIVYADGVELGPSKNIHNIPLCTQHVMVVAKEGWNQSTINFLKESVEHIVMPLRPLEEKQMDGLLGFEPPECIREGAVDQECVQKWFSRVRKRAEERADHTHHEGCSHE